MFDKITDAIKFIESNAGERNLIIGLSGGLDSAVVLAMAVRAVGKERVRVYMLPYDSDNSDSLKYCMELLSDYDVRSSVLDIKEIVDSFNVDESYRRGNIMARVRMTMLYDAAMEHNGLVVGTTNLSEYFTGYFTKCVGSDMEPLMSFTKNELFKAAKLLGIPQSIIDRKPSADLEENQTDENDMGLSYEDIDWAIETYYSSFEGLDAPTDFGEFLFKLAVLKIFPEKREAIVKMLERYNSNEHKLKPIVANWRKL